MPRTILFISIISLFASCQSTSSESTLAFSDSGNSPLVPSDTFKLDTAYSLITWIGSKPRVQHNGTFRLDSGMIGLRSGEIVTGKVFINIGSLKVMDLDSAKENATKLYTHLLSDDFFDEANHPQGIVDFHSIISFDTSMITESIREFMVSKPTHQLNCTLTLRGKTLPIEIPISLDTSDSTRVSMEGKFTIDRTRWDISYDDEATVIDKIKDQFIHNKVYVGFYVEALHSNLSGIKPDKLSY